MAWTLARLRRCWLRWVWPRVTFTQYGYTFRGLFYEPSNWLPFIAYFVVGAVCGYVQLRNSEAIRAERDQNELVRNRNTFLTQLYHDAIEDKRAYRRQIVGRRQLWQDLCRDAGARRAQPARHLSQVLRASGRDPRRTIRWRSTMFRAGHLHAWWQQVPRLPKMPHARSRSSSLHLFWATGVVRTCG